MIQWLPPLLCGFAAYLVARALVPWTIRLAPRIGAVDVPCDGRRLHSRPTPRTGGLAILGAYLVCVLASGASYKQTAALLLGAALMALLGLFDDVFRLPALLKLTVQLIAAATSQGFGVGAALSGISAPFGLLLGTLLITLLVNAHNMIDGLDGLAAGVSALEAVALAVIFFMQGVPSNVALALTLAGCTLGFLHWNRHPARVFMGDTGSQLVGYILGALALRVDISPSPLGLLPLLLIFALPLSDLGFAVARRVLRGQSPFAADRGHWHHRLVDAGLSRHHACVWLWLLSALPALTGVLLTRVAWYPFAVYTLLAAAALVMLLDLRIRRTAVKR